MNRGDRVQVILAGGQGVVRRIWQMTNSGALITTEESYLEAERTGQEPPTLGFRREFIKPVL
jgi:hypothetical protein